MTVTANVQPEMLERIENRLARMEEILQRLSRGQHADEQPVSEPKRAQETTVEPWQHLVQRAHPWRKQLSLKGRNLTARQLVGSIIANQFDDANAATNYGLPVEAVREAILYVNQNQKLLEAEARIEQLMLERGDIARSPQPLSR